MSVDKIIPFGHAMLNRRYTSQQQVAEDLSRFGLLITEMANFVKSVMDHANSESDRLFVLDMNKPPAGRRLN